MAGLARRFEPLPGLRRVRIVGAPGFALWNFSHMAAMTNQAGKSSGEVLRLDFARRLMVQVRGSVVTSDAGSLAHRELDDALGLTMAGKMLPDARTGRNGVMRLSGLALPMGTKGLAATFPSRPQCGVATAKEISYVKDGRFVRLGPRFR